MVEAKTKCRFLPIGMDNASIWAENINSILNQEKKNNISSEDLQNFDVSVMAEKISECYLGKR